MIRFNSAGVNYCFWHRTGMLIPPSNLMIVYSTIAGSVSVAALFTGGYVPGILWGLLVMFLAGVKSKENVDMLQNDEFLQK